MSVSPGKFEPREIRVTTDEWVDLKVDEYTLSKSEAKDLSQFQGRILFGKPEERGDRIVYRFVSKEDQKDYERILKLGETRGFGKVNLGQIQSIKNKIFGSGSSLKARMSFAEELLRDSKTPTRVKIRVAQRLNEAEKDGFYTPEKVSIWQKEDGSLRVAFLETPSKGVGEGAHAKVYEIRGLTLEPKKLTAKDKPHVQKILQAPVSTNTLSSDTESEIESPLESEKRGIKVLELLREANGGHTPIGITEPPRLHTSPSGETSVIMKKYPELSYFQWIQAQKELPSLGGLAEMFKRPVKGLAFMAKIGAQHFDIKGHNLLTRLFPEKAFSAGKIAIGDWGNSFILYEIDPNASFSKNRELILKGLGTAKSMPDLSPFSTPNSDFLEYANIFTEVYETLRKDTDTLTPQEIEKFYSKYGQLRRLGEKIEVFEMGLVFLSIFTRQKDPRGIDQFLDHSFMGFIINLKAGEIEKALDEGPINEEIVKTFGEEGVAEVKELLLGMLSLDPSKRISASEVEERYESLMFLKK